MRVNIYEEELTSDVILVSTYVREKDVTYWGIRFFLKSSPDLHHTRGDDDRSAVTIWCGSKEDCRNFLRTTYDNIFDSPQ